MCAFREYRGCGKKRPKPPSAEERGCCGAACRTGRSLQVQNQTDREVEMCGLSVSSLHLYQWLLLQI